MARRSKDDLQFEPSPALVQNRQRLNSARNKVDAIQRNDLPRSPSASRSTTPKSRRPQTDRIAKSLSNNESDFDLVMGKDGKAVTSKVRIKDHVIRHVEQKGQGRSDLRPASLHIPIVRPQRLATPDGRTSFHFSHESVTKTRNAVVNDRGQVNRPGAAKAHNKYIERESAVAIDDDGITLEPANDQDIEKDAAKLAANDASLDKPSTSKQEMYFDRPISTAFLRSYRATLGSLFSDPDTDPRGEPAGQVDGLRNVPGRDLVPESADAQMLLRADEVPVVGRNGISNQGMRRKGDGNHEGHGRISSLPPVPARLSRPRVVQPANNEKIIEALGGRSDVHDHKTAEGQGKYIERQEALAMQPDGTRVLYTNIDPDAEQRAEFWRLVEEHEREADADKMTFKVNQSPEFWLRVSKHKDCPRELAEAIINSDHDHKVTISTPSNMEMRRFLSGVEGWQDAGPKLKDETNEEYKKRKGQSLCQFQDGRGGRVQYRIIGELPHELDVKGRASILKEFSDEFAKRNLPFVAVMHAPDHTNNDKNWHFHLVYYDRPCSRITEQHLANYPEHENPKNQTVDRPGIDVIGQWDFTVVEKYKTSSREIRQRYPFAQSKVKEVSRDQKWIEQLRRRLADITNDHLEKDGVQRRLDPRRHSEMGIHNDPQEHLGTKLANLEAMGVATPLGVSNEEKQWEATQRKLDHDLIRRRSMIEQQAQKWLQKSEKSDHLSDQQKAIVRATVLKWHQHKNEAEEHSAIAENVTQHIERTVSRAMKVKETCEKQLAAINAGRVTKFQASRAEILKDKSLHAVMWLDEMNKILQDEKKLVIDCRKKYETENLFAEKLQIDIERALAPLSAREVAENQRRKDAEAEAERIAKVANDNQRSEERRNALVKQQMDKWINDIIKSDRRLIREGTKIVPANLNDDDRKVLSAINANAMQPRLAGIKKQQDGRIKGVVEEITKNPQNVILQRDGTQRRYVLITSNRKLAKDFASFIDDPAIVKARDAAIAINQNRQAAAVARTQEPIKAKVPVEKVPAEKIPVERPVAPKENNLQPVPETGRRYALNERIVQEVRNGAHRIIVRDGKATLSERQMADLKIEKNDLDDAALQKRLISIASVQEREIKRLTAYARSNPDRITERDGYAVLSAKAPKELVDISLKWNKDESVDIMLKSISQAARTKQVQNELPIEPAPRQMPTGEQNNADRKRQRDDVPEPAKAKDNAPSQAPKPVATEIQTDYSLREEARAYAEQERRRMAAIEEAKKRRISSSDKTGVDDVTRAILAASQKASTKGAHVLIDNWIAAVQDGASTEERQQIALRIINEKTAREKLEAIDRQVAQRIQEDVKLAKEDLQLGLGLDIGQTPKRS